MATLAVHFLQTKEQIKVNKIYIELKGSSFKGITIGLGLHAGNLLATDRGTTAQNHLATRPTLVTRHVI